MRPAGSTGLYVFAMILGAFVLVMGLGLIATVFLNDVIYVRAGVGAVFVIMLGGSVVGWALKAGVAIKG